MGVPLYGIFNFDDQVDGDTLELTNINFFDTNQVAVDMTDVSAVAMKVRRGNKKGKELASLSIGSGIKWVNQSLGQLRISDTDDQVQITWGHGKHYYDIQFTYTTPAGLVRTYIQGEIPVVKDTTY